MQRREVPRRSMARRNSASSRLRFKKTSGFIEAIMFQKHYVIKTSSCENRQSAKARRRKERGGGGGYHEGECAGPRACSQTLATPGALAVFFLLRVNETRRQCRRASR